MLNPHVFRAYDVRGLVGRDINRDVFRQVGRAYGTLIRRTGGRRVAVGQDNRVSSAELRAGFVEGVRAAGVDVVDVGLVTTPILYFATAHWTLDGRGDFERGHGALEARSPRHDYFSTVSAMIHLARRPRSSSTPATASRG